ncbi:uncharacterized protein [Henckelia pumila]|uniref:uncharacterized protein n=1 Tax=Henckelia pumila TaxID=405737 RepID=UPI003C6E020A
MKFKSAQEFMEVLRDHSVRKGYELVLKKNERSMITCECKNGCDWRIHASLVMGGPTFQIKTIKGKHTCAISNENKLANSRYLAKRIHKIVRDNPDIKIDQLRNLIKSKCEVDVSKWKVIRAKKTAIQKIRGVDSVQYHHLWNYCETLRNFNPGTVGRDGNDNMVPIAFAVVQVENRENWTLFLTILLEDVGGMRENKWNFISDRQKGLVEALKELVPDSEHIYCLRHMYQNFKKIFKTLDLKELFWKAATTGNKNEFEEHMKKIALVDPKVNVSQETACKWLKKIPAVHWARSHFSSGCLCDVVVNNLSESFNSYIMEARDKPIITMLECIRNKLMKRIQLRKVGMERYIGQICPNILKKINKNQKFSKNFYALYSGENEYQVQCLSVHGVLTQHVVDLMKNICTCGMFQLCGFPCSHACTAIGHSRRNLEDFVLKFYTKDEYLKVYSYMIHVIPGKIDFCKTPWQQLNAPIYKSKKGRPQKKRKRQADEGSSVSTRKGPSGNQDAAETATIGSMPSNNTPANTTYESLSGTPQAMPKEIHTQNSGNQNDIGATSFAPNLYSSNIDSAARRVQMSHLNRAKLDASASAKARATATGNATARARATATGDSTFRATSMATATRNANSRARATVNTTRNENVAALSQGTSSSSSVFDANTNSSRWARRLPR